MKSQTVISYQLPVTSYCYCYCTKKSGGKKKWAKKKKVKKVGKKVGMKKKVGVKNMSSKSLKKSGGKN